MKAKINNLVIEKECSYEEFKKFMMDGLRYKGWSFKDSYMLANVWLFWCTGRGVTECEITYRESIRIR